MLRQDNRAAVYGKQAEATPCPVGGIPVKGGYAHLVQFRKSLRLEFGPRLCERAFGDMLDTEIRALDFLIEAVQFPLNGAG